MLPLLFNSDRLEDLGRIGSSRGRLDHMVLDNYLSAADARLHEIDGAIRGADLARTRLLAHRWRGTAAALGLERLVEILRSIEKRSLPTELEEWLLQLHQVHQQSSLALQAYRSQQP